MENKSVVATQQNQKDDFIQTQQEYNELGTKIHGCFTLFVVVFITALFTGVYLITIDQYKKNKRHVNTISAINENDKKIVISDVNTGKKRTIDYNGYGLYHSVNYDYMPTFQDAVRYSKIGDTVVFISSKYDKQTNFEMQDPKNKSKHTLLLNMDSVFKRIQNQK